MKKVFLLSAGLILVIFAQAGLMSISGSKGGAVQNNNASDFATRCAAAGVVRCVTFDSDTDFNRGNSTDTGAWGLPEGLFPVFGTTTFRAVRDTAVKADGTSSLRFDIPASSGADSSGAWFANFKDDGSFQVGEGQEVYVQWRERIDQTILDTVYLQADGASRAGGIKLADISAGDKPTCSLGNANSTVCPTSCWDFEVVTQNVDQHGVPMQYANCAGPWPYTPLDGFTSNVTVQNVVNCLYPTYPDPPCVKLHGNEWMTFQVHIRVGHWNTWDSTIQLWVAREGQASTLVIDCSPTATNKCSNFVDSSANNGWYLYNSDTSFKIGKVWLLPYQTNKSANFSYTATSVWYDDLIVSTNKISDPGMSGTIAASLTSPTPVGTIVSQTGATLGATTDQASGTFYSVVDTGSALNGVTAAQIKTAKKASGSAALSSCNAAVGNTSPSCGATGLSASTAYVYASVQNNTNGDSNVVSGSFTTASGGGGGTSASLATLATGAPGTWVRWPQADIPCLQVNPPSCVQDPVTSNGLRALHDELHHKILYYGHGHTGRLSRMLTFDEATEVWSSNNTDVPLADGGTDAHQFTGYTGNPANGWQFFNAGDGGGNGNFRQAFGASSWTNISQDPAGAHAQVAGASFNPNLGSQGSVILGSLYGVEIYDVAGGTWTENWRAANINGPPTDPQGNPPLGDESITFWDPRTNAVYVGGGNVSHLVKIPTSGTHSIKSDIPGAVPPYFGESSQVGGFVVDGYVSTYASTAGRYRRPKLILPGTSMKAYDGVGDAWNTVSGTPPDYGNGNHTAFYAVMADYDGTAFWTESASDGSLQAYFMPNLRADEL